ncbi:MAG TPA: hypothetical protein VFF91_04590 [Pseudoxanthomonas sp.]|nr:hypothetical protein [Pseudoxanthomonas sp.]
MREDQPAPMSVAYLSRVAAAAVLLVAAALFCMAPPWPGPPPAVRLTLLAAIALGCLLLVPLAARAYRRCDEFHRRMHQTASVRTLPWLVAGFGVLGVLQAAGALPPLNQFASALLVAGVWGVQLMLADRRSR